MKLIIALCIDSFYFILKPYRIFFLHYNLIKIPNHISFLINLVAKQFKIMFKFIQRIITVLFFIFAYHVSFSQDSILFNDTIANNIKLGAQNATDSAVLEASEIANANEFIQHLPKKFDTNIGDSGNTLSGGQKQRLSIARAVLKNPPIMILDEATSALDTESEQLVQVALEKMMQNRTSLVIAHRLSTIQKADKIVVLKKGKIVEEGKHQDLLANKGEYFKLVNMQSLS